MNNRENENMIKLANMIDDAMAQEKEITIYRAIDEEVDVATFVPKIVDDSFDGVIRIIGDGIEFKLKTNDDAYYDGDTFIIEKKSSTVYIQVM